MHYHTQYEHVGQFHTGRSTFRFWHDHAGGKHAYHYTMGDKEWHNRPKPAHPLIHTQLWNAQVKWMLRFPFASDKPEMSLVAHIFMMREWERRREANSLCRWTEYHLDTPWHFVQCLTKESQIKCIKGPELQLPKNKKHMCFFVFTSSVLTGADSLWHKPYKTLLQLLPLHLDHCCCLVGTGTDFWQS